MQTALESRFQSGDMEGREVWEWSGELQPNRHGVYNLCNEWTHKAKSQLLVQDVSDWRRKARPVG